MSSLSQALSVALSGLRTSTNLISVASDNISNAQTPGYSRKTASVVSVQYGADPGGSTIASFGRATDQALTSNYNTATTTAGYYSAQDDYMTQVQAILDATSDNPALSSSLANFSAAWSKYSSQPESTIQQQNVLTAGSQLASTINSIVTQVRSLDAQVQSDTATTVTSLNDALTQVASLNQQIQAATASNQQTGGLMDQRDKLVNQIAQYTTVNVQDRANGQIALYTTSGQLLVDSGVAVQFDYDGTSITNRTTGATVNSSFTGGSLQAQLDFRDTSASAASSTTPGVGVIAKLKAQLATLAGSFVNNGSSTASLFDTSYAAAATASTATGASQNGDTVDSHFFTVTYTNGVADPATFAINANLLNGTSDLPQTSTQAIASSFNGTASYTASGLSATNVTCAQLGSAILSAAQQQANTISTNSTTATSQQTYYQQALSNATGVNIDNELANLVAYQNSYAASAHVISTINQMLTTLMNAI